MKDSEGRIVHPALSTWQWLGVIAVIIGGTIGVGHRMQNTVAVFADANNMDHVRIRDELRELAKSLPPDWLIRQVNSNTSQNDQMHEDIASIRVGIAEIQGSLVKISERNGM